MTPQHFITRWDGADGSERANYPLFISDLCELLQVEKPQPALADDWHNTYVNERYIDARDGESAGNARFIDTYRRGCFICEAKSFALGKNAETAERKLVKAKSQAESYARNLPESEPRPPILMVVNVGRFIALYAQFKDNDRAYEMYPDRASYKIGIADLARDDIRERLRQVWLDPYALNPERISARVTRAVSVHLGALARELEKAGHDSHLVAGFLTRCLFTMFAEDVGLLPSGAFTQLLTRQLAAPAGLQPNLEDLWRAMDSGKFAVSLQAEVAHFNGKLCKTSDALPLTRAQIETLIAAAKQDWKHVEPAIFGTLIERALDPAERHSLGAHFTPRAYVERLVLPTVIEPLRNQWANVQAAAIAATTRARSSWCASFRRRCRKPACSTRPAAPATSSTLRWNT
ncbi:MAG: type IIL restriction-modification enzyme MmeI [Thiobacillus sp.]